MRKISDEKVRHIHRLYGKGLPQKEIAKIVGVSVATVNKHVASPKKYPDSPEEPTPVPQGEEVPEQIPEGVDLGTVERWIPKIEKMIEAADAAKDYGAASSLIAKLHSLLEHKRKASPPPKADPNENPDFIEAARRAKERLHKLIDTASG